MFLADLQATEKLGRRMGELAPEGLVVALTGDLGTGKSSLARAIGRGLGVEERIPSPTFVIVNSYRARLDFHHVDLYRLEGADELEQLGLEELIGTGVSAIEWAERFEELLPPDTLRLVLDEQEDGRTIAASGSPHVMAWWSRVIG